MRIYLQFVILAGDFPRPFLLLGVASELGVND